MSPVKRKDYERKVGHPSVSAKQDSERLMNAILPLAEKMLKRHGELYPYGGYMKLDGTIVEVGADDPEADHPKSRDLMYFLRSSFQEMARAGRCKAVAIVFDVAVSLPKSDRKSDAIQVCVDHADGYSAEVFFPYHLTDRKVVYDEAFAQEGKHDFFACA
jgi:hypothetical protein